jgi:ribosomal protein S12
MNQKAINTTTETTANLIKKAKNDEVVLMGSPSARSLCLRKIQNIAKPPTSAPTSKIFITINAGIAHSLWAYI